MVAHNPTRNTITIQPTANGGFIVHTSKRLDEFATANAFTNAADLLAWITGELAPINQPASHSITSARVASDDDKWINQPEQDGWIHWSGHANDIPLGVKHVDVKFRIGTDRYSCAPKEINWNNVTHWRPAK